MKKMYLQLSLLSIALFFISSKKLVAQTYPANPDVIISCFAGGPLSANYVANAAAVISDPYNSRVSVAATTMPTHDKVWATAGQVGSVYGIAYSPSTSKAYASAYVKRHAQLGPGNGGNPSGHGSAGAIYVMNPPASGGSPAGVNVLLDIGAAAGTTVRTPSSDWTCDPAMYEVGRVGWGDIDVSLDGTVLWAMNLFNKSLYKINASTGAIVGTYPIPGVTGGLPFDAPVTTNENLDLRPFGLKVTGTKVYVGVISSGESLYPSGGLPDPCNTPTGTPALRGYVFSFDIAGSAFSNVPVLDFPFEGASWNNGSCSSFGTEAKWMYWAPLANMQASYGNWTIRVRNPVIADIEIDDAGNLLVGLRNITDDRLSTIPGLFFPNCTSGSDSGGWGGFGGQVLKACSGPSNWTIESNGACGGTSGFNSEVFFNYEVTHSNGDIGGAISYKTGTGEILIPGSPGLDQGAMLYLKESTKTYTTSELNTIYSLQAFPLDPDFNPLFGKSNGLGDVDLQSNLSCTVPTLGATVTTNAGTCNGTMPNNDATASLTVTGGDKADIVEAATYGSGPAYGAGTNKTVTAGAVSFTGLKHATQYTIRVWNADNICFEDKTFTTASITCNPSCTTPTNNTPTTAAGTCTGSNLNNDATISITGITGDKIAISTAGAASFDGSVYASANAVSAGSYTFSNLQHGASYIIRIYSLTDTCYKDVTVTTPTRTCCTSPNCGTVTVTKN